MPTEKIAGVAAVFHIPGAPERGCVTLQELRTKRSTNKVAGQRTIPMESSLPGESELETLARLTREEVHFTNFPLYEALLASTRIAVSELNVGIFVPIYSVPVPSHVQIVLGSESEEVADLDWTTFEEIISEPIDSHLLRPGSFEGVNTHLIFQRNPDSFVLMKYRFQDLKHKIPTKLFDKIEAGLSVETALSQLNLAWRPGLEPQTLAHLQVSQVPLLRAAG